MKIKEFIKKNTTGVIIGAILFGGITGVVAATALTAADVTYTGNNQTTVKSALDDLYLKAQNAGVDSDSIDFATIQTDTAKRILASSKGLCINHNNKLNCFKINNWAEEQDHIKQVFPVTDSYCSGSSEYVECYSSDFSCGVYSSGGVDCTDMNSDDSDCSVDGDGSVNCN